MHGTGLARCGLELHLHPDLFDSGPEWIFNFNAALNGVIGEEALLGELHGGFQAGGWPMLPCDSSCLPP